MRSFHPAPRDARRRRLMAVASGSIATALLLAACSTGSAAAPKSTKASSSTEALSGSITAAEWGGVWDTALRDVSPSFEKKSGVTVNNTVNSGNVVTALESNPGAYDLAWTIGTTAIQAYDNGDTDAIDTSKIHAWDKLNPTLREALTVKGKVTAVPISYGAEGILYRSDLVDSKVTSWKDLWGSDLKGQVSIQQAPSIGGLMLMLSAADEYGSGLKDYKTGFAKMAQLEKNVQYLYSVSSDPINDLASGSLKAAVTLADQGVALKDKHVKVVIPKEGAPWSVQAISIPKAAKNKAAVYAFINYMLDKETQQTWSGKAAAAPARDDVTLTGAAKSKVLETKAVAKNLYPLDWKAIADNTDDWTKKWQSIFTK